MENKTVVLSEWINENLARTRIKQKELAEMTGISESAVSQFKKGKLSVCDSDTLRKMAEAFGTEVPLLRKPEQQRTEAKPLPIKFIPADDLVSVPVFDSVSAGPGAYADEHIVGYRLAEVPNPLEKDNYYFVNVCGDSMSPMIPDRSMVLVHKQDFIENDKVAIVLIDGEEAVVKRVRYEKGAVVLISENEDYEPRIFRGDNILSLRILGKVVECVTRIN